MPFFSNVSLAWSFGDSDYLALILIRVLKVHFSIFTILFRSKLLRERLCLSRFGYAVLGRVSQPGFWFFYVLFLVFTLKQVWKQLSRVSLDWFNFQKFVLLDIYFSDLFNIVVGATMSLMFDWSNPVRVSKSVLDSVSILFLCFTLMWVWERLFRFRFDRFELAKSDFRFSVLTLVREWLCQAELTDWLWFEYRDPFRSFEIHWRFVCVCFLFSYVEAIMRERLSHFRFGWFEIRKSVFLVSFFWGWS